MPDTKFSWPMLKEHLRRYLWIYLIGIAVCLLGTNLLWTATRPQPGNDETVIVYLVGGYANTEALDGVAADMLGRGQARDDRLKQVEFQWLQYSDEESDYTGAMLLMTRLTLGEGDAFIASGSGLDALVRSDALVPLEEIVDGGWLSEYNLEPYYAEVTDEETGETTRYMAGLRLDGVEGFLSLGAFNNEGAVLGLSLSSQNPETARYTLEVMLEDLAKEAGNAATEG